MIPSCISRYGLSYRVFPKFMNLEAISGELNTDLEYSIVAADYVVALCFRKNQYSA